MILPEEDRVSYSSSQDTLARATARVEQLTANLDKINANPKATTKQIVAAMNQLNAATEIQLKEIQNTLNPATVKQDLGTSGFTEVPGSGGSPGGGTTAATVPPTPSPTPPQIPEIKTEIVKPPVKTAPIDTLLIDQDTISPDLMTDLIFEDIGGQELINIARNDTINGQIVSYQPIKNLTSIQQQYNPNNILSLQDTSDKYFINFPIKLETHLLDEGEGDGPSGAYVYVEAATGDLIVELVNLENDQQLEVQISQSGTIYEAEFNES